MLCISRVICNIYFVNMQCNIYSYVQSKHSTCLQCNIYLVYSVTFTFVTVKLFQLGFRFARPVTGTTSQLFVG